MENKQKISYEELEKKVTAYEIMLKQQGQQIKNQVAAAHSKMQELYDALSYKRLDYLFKVLELSDKFTSDFVITCAEEITKTMVVPESKEE